MPVDMNIGGVVHSKMELKTKQFGRKMKYNVYACSDENWNVYGRRREKIYAGMSRALRPPKIFEWSRKRIENSFLCTNIKYS